MKYRYLIALAAAVTGTAFGGLSGPLPVFKTAQQLAAWRAEMAAEAAAKPATVTTSDEGHTFFTGKPYVASSGGYAFKYRSYNPELARWTSEDPIGFPNGSNNQYYAPTPTSGLDALGLFYSGTSYAEVLTDMATWNALMAAADTLTTTAMKHADGTLSGPWTLSASEVDIVKSCSDYTHIYTPMVKSGISDADYGSASTPVDHVLFSKPSDEYYAFGHADMSTEGTKSEVSPGAWGYDATVTLSDTYTFAQYAGAGWWTPTALGYRLQSHGYLTEFTTTGVWNDHFFGYE